MTTLVNLDLRQTSAFQVDGATTTGRVRFWPLRRTVTDDYVLLKLEFNVAISGGVGSVILPTEATVYWQAVELINGTRSAIRTYVVPDTGPVDYADLTEIDPATLDPEAPLDPAWLASLGAETSARQTADAILTTDVAALHRVVAPNSVTDQTAALQAALDAFAAAGVTPTGVGTWRIDSTLVLTGSVDLADVTLEYHGTGTAVEIGDGSILYRREMVLPRVQNALKSGVGWAAGSVGVKAINLNTCTVAVPYVQGFETGLYVYGQSGGNAYNTVLVGHLDNNKRNLVLGADATGWSNQNTYIGGRYSHNSGEGDNTVGARHILLEASTNAPNNNLWINPSVEGDVALYQIDVDAGSYNRWTLPRLESDNGGRIRWGATAQLNRVDGGYGVSASTITRVAGETKNTVFTADLSEFYGSSSVGMIRIKNGNSDASPAVSMYGTTSLADADWVWRWAANNLTGKRAGDVAARLNLNANGGSLLLGSGAATPTMGIRAVSTSGIAVDAGHLYSGTDNTYDVGLITSLRFRYIRAATALVTGSGATGSRPAAATAGVGAVFYDTTLGHPVWSTGSAWVDLAGGATNLTATAAPTTVTINSDTGTDAAIALADGTNAGLESPAEFTKLGGIATGATANSSDATLLARANHTGTQTAATVSDFSTAADARIAAADLQPHHANLDSVAGGTVGLTGLESLAAVDQAAGRTAIAAQRQDSDLDAIAALGWTVADKMAYTTGSHAFALADLTAFARTLLDDADAATARATLALGNVPNVDATARANHTGTQTASTVSDFTAAAIAAMACRTVTAASSATPTPNADTTDEFDLTAQAAAAAFVDPTGTPVNGQRLWIRIKDNGTARAITWSSGYVASGVATMLATTVINKTHLMMFRYNSAATKWVCYACDQVGF